MTGFSCGGVVSKTMFDSDPWAYMMCYYMDDERFDEYKQLCSIKEKWAEREARLFFKKYAQSAI